MTWMSCFDFWFEESGSGCLPNTNACFELNPLHSLSLSLVYFQAPIKPMPLFPFEPLVWTIWCKPPIRPIAFWHESFWSLRVFRPKCRITFYELAYSCNPTWQRLLLLPTWVVSDTSINIIRQLPLPLPPLSHAPKNYCITFLPLIS